ncbi:hypothetical protein [Mycobacteroides abscessus]|uniref:hypothetical protein n=1 Tax=Mycobacteroides abscessus TaxID=36809 RepID=UPI0011C389E0|nr:hypothetical protein [Mycobacteroides abscessus]MDB2210878.1 hypothetical protein [Mycobacteroides abscessus subsp. massiliense]MDB2233985.1 hypothetical protein [Mycobacteroides abscessus subsp. massiliense]
MARYVRVRAIGEQRKDIDPAAMLQILLAVAFGEEHLDTAMPSPDVFGAAIEDRAPKQRQEPEAQA